MPSSTRSRADSGHRDHRDRFIVIAQIGIVIAESERSDVFGWFGRRVGLRVGAKRRSRRASARRLPTRRSFQFDPVCRVHDAIEERVRDCRISHVVVPVFDGQLAGDDRRSRAMAVLDDLEHVASLLVAQRRDPPVVEHEDVDLREATEQPRVRAVGVRESELLDEPRHAAIRDAVARAASLLRERAGEVRLSRPRCAGDDHVGVRGDPRARTELADGGAIELALRREVDVLDARVREAELRRAQRPCEALVVAREVLGVDEQPEAAVEVELVTFGCSRCESQASAMVPRRMPRNLSIVGSVSIDSVSFLQW